MSKPFGEQIRKAVAGWAEVEEAPHRFGGIEFRVHNHELGHLHGNRLADLPFPKRVRDELVAEGQASAHHVLPDTGWVSFYIAEQNDVERAIALFRLNYERLTQPGNPRIIANRNE